MTSTRSLILLGAAHVHLDDHLRVLDEAGWCVSHVHDRDAGRRERFCDRLGAQPLDDTAALARIGTHAAVICSETVHHEADITAALRAGLPVFTEKPMAASAAAARRCADMATTAGLMLSTGYFMRTNDGLRTVRDWIDEGAIGDVLQARMHFAHDGGFADWLDLHSWMGDPSLAAYDGFVDEAVHCFDTLAWMIGPIAGGAARTGRALDLGVDTQGAAVVQFECGATGVIEAGWTDTAMRLELDVTGTAGGIALQEGRITLTPRGAEAPARTATLSPLDAGEGIRPFLVALDGSPAPGLVPPHDAAAVNALLDGMGLRRA